MPDSALLPSHATIRGTNKQEYSINKEGRSCMCWRESHMLGRPGPLWLLPCHLCHLVRCYSKPPAVPLRCPYCCFDSELPLAPHLMPPWLFLLYIASTPVLSVSAKANTGSHKSLLWSFVQEPIPTFCTSQYISDSHASVPNCQSVRARLHSCGVVQ